MASPCVPVAAGMLPVEETRLFPAGLKVTSVDGNQDPVEIRCKSGLAEEEGFAKPSCVDSVEVVDSAFRTIRPNRTFHGFSHVSHTRVLQADCYLKPSVALLSTSRIGHAAVPLAMPASSLRSASC